MKKLLLKNTICLSLIFASNSFTAATSTPTVQQAPVKKEETSEVKKDETTKVSLRNEELELAKKENLYNQYNELTKKIADEKDATKQAELEKNLKDLNFDATKADDYKKSLDAERAKLNEKYSNFFKNYKTATERVKEFSKKTFWSTGLRKGLTIGGLTALALAAYLIVSNNSDSEEEVTDEE